MKSYSKKRLALVLKMTIVIGCGSALASCGNAKNNQAGNAALVQQLQAQVASYQRAHGNQANPTTGQPAASSAGSVALNGVWVGPCQSSSSLGSDASGTAIGSYQEAYWFQGTAWYAEYAFWGDGQCGGSDGGTLLTPQNLPTFAAGYIGNMPNITAGSQGQLQLYAWDAQNSLGYSSGNNWGAALGNNVLNMAFRLVQPNGAANGGDLFLGDVVTNTPNNPTMEFGTWDGSS